MEQVGILIGQLDRALVSRKLPDSVSLLEDAIHFYVSVFCGTVVYVILARLTGSFTVRVVAAASVAVAYLVYREVLSERAPERKTSMSIPDSLQLLMVLDAMPGIPGILLEAIDSIVYLLQHQHKLLSVAYEFRFEPIPLSPQLRSDLHILQLIGDVKIGSPDDIRVSITTSGHERVANLLEVNPGTRSTYSKLKSIVPKMGGMRSEMLFWEAYESTARSL